MKALLPFIFLIGSCLMALTVAAADQETSGIGVALGKEGEALVVKMIVPDSPAARSKALRVGDRILEVGQEELPAVAVQGMPLENAVRLIRGPQGTIVRLTVVATGRDSSQARVVIIRRGELKELARWGDGELLAIGSKAPDIGWITFPERKSEKLGNFAGKIRVLEFWATWCAPCQTSMANMQTYPGKNPAWSGRVVLIAASVDEKSDVALMHLHRKGWNRSHNVWVDSPAIKAYRVNSLPTTYIIDPMGAIVAAGNELDVVKIVNRLLKKE